MKDFYDQKIENVESQQLKGTLVMLQTMLNILLIAREEGLSLNNVIEVTVCKVGEIQEHLWIEGFEFVEEGK